MKLNKITNHKAFTLVELLAVIFIIGLLAVIAIPTINKVTKQSREELYQMQIGNIEKGAKNWAADNIPILPTENDEIITLTLGQLKIAGFVEPDIKNPRTKKPFPNDMEITIKKIMTGLGYEYKVQEETGGINDTIDENSPIIILNGDAHEILEIHSDYIDKGVIAKDPNGSFIDEIEVIIKLNTVVVSDIDTSKLAQYKITYTINYEGIKASAIRTITVKDTIPPVLTIPNDIVIDLDDLPSFDIMAGVSTTDNSLTTPVITTSGNISTLRGTYQITYTATDVGGNKTSKTRKIKVTEKAILMVEPNTGFDYTPYFDGPILKNQIESIEFVTTNLVPSNAIGSWDVSAAKNGIVKAWYHDKDDNGFYEVSIGGEYGVYANPNSTGLFSKLTNLKTLKLSNLNTSNVTNMTDMFSHLVNLISLDLSNFDTSKTTTMRRMFYGVSSLTSLDLSSFDTSNVIDMGLMFRELSSLASLDLRHFNTLKAKSMLQMFANMTSLTNLNISSFNTSNVTDMSYMFYNLSNLTSLDVSSFNTSKVTNMSYMFRSSTKIKSLDLSVFDTSNVTDMSYMFYNASSLTNLNLSSFNTLNVTTMTYMFYGLSSLTSLNLSNFNNSNVTNMSYMFYNSNGLTNLNLSNFNTANVTNMTYMFYGLSSLTSLDLSSLNTSKVTNMLGMFRGSNKITSMNLSNFDTSNVTTIRSMFYDTTALINLNISSFNTSKVTDIAYMFRGNNALTSVDFRNATFESITDMTAMFSGVKTGVTIYTKDSTTKPWLEARLSESSRTGNVIIAS